MRNNYFFTRDIWHHWAGVLIHMLSRNSWGHTCKSPLIFSTGVTEQRVFTQQWFLHQQGQPKARYLFTENCSNILLSWPEMQSALSVFWPPLRRKVDVVSHACHPSLSRGGWVPMSLGLQCAQPAFHITFGISLMIPELRSAGCLRKGEPTWTRHRASQFLAVQSSFLKDIYWDCGDFGQLTVDFE